LPDEEHCPEQDGQKLPLIADGESECGKARARAERQSADAVKDKRDGARALLQCALS